MTSHLRRAATALPLLCITAVLASSITNRGPYFPPIGGNGVPAPIPVVEYPVSDDYVRAFILSHDGPAVASRMITRYRPEQDARPQPVRYFVTPITRAIWGGYITDVSGAFNFRVQGASGWFTAIHHNCTFGCPTVGSWAGIGGWNGSGNLAQTGLDQVSMRAFYEFTAPNPPTPATELFSVNQGDAMFAEVDWDAGTARYMIFVEDTTTGVFFSSEFSYNPDLTTAEWITEVYGGSVPAIGGIPFSSTFWYDQNNAAHTESNGAQTVWQVTLVDPNGGCVVPTALSGDAAFTNNTPNC